MRKFNKIALGFLAILGIGCTETTDLFKHTEYANVRSLTGLDVAITTPEKQIINLSASTVTLSNATNGSMTVVIDAGTINAQTITAEKVEVTNDANHLRLIKNPGINQAVFTGNAGAVILPSGSSIQATMLPSDVITVGQQIVIDELDTI